MAVQETRSYCSLLGLANAQSIMIMHI